MEIEDLFRLHRVSDPQISPDGSRVAYVVTDVLKAENRTNADIWVVDADPSTGSGQVGGNRAKLTSSPKHDRHPRWSPDGKWIAFESVPGRRRNANLPLLTSRRRRGAQADKSSQLARSQAVWSPGRKIPRVRISPVFPEFSQQAPCQGIGQAQPGKTRCPRPEQGEGAHLRPAALSSLGLVGRGPAGSSLFVIGINADGLRSRANRATSRPARTTCCAHGEHVQRGRAMSFRLFCPTERSSGVLQRHRCPCASRAFSTGNHDLWSVNLATGERKQLTTNLAADGLPRFSPDGKYLAYHAQNVTGFEADRWQLWLLDPRDGASAAA